MTDKTKIGRRGEEAACDFLLKEGHTILERNWRSGHLEVDIISLDREGLHIVEVKSRTAPCQALPQENVTAGKMAALSKAARAYLSVAGKRLGDVEVFFDVFSIVFDGEKNEIEYIPKAFIPIYD